MPSSSAARLLLAAVMAMLAGLAFSGCVEPVPQAGLSRSGITLVRAGDLPSPTGYAWEPSAAIDPLDGRHAIVAVSDGEPGLAVYATFDAGATWSRTALPVGAAAGGGRQAEWTFMGDPVAWFAPDGTAYVGGLGRTVTRVQGAAAIADGADIFVARSSDGGRSFGPAQVVAHGQGTVAIGPTVAGVGTGSASTDLHNHDKPLFAAGPGGRLLAAWNDLGQDYYVSGPAGVAPVPYEGNEMLASWSDDGGATWSAPTMVEATSPRSPYPFFRPDGRMHIAHGRYTDPDLRVATWDGQAWSTVVVGVGRGMPTVAVAPDGSLRIAVADEEGAPGLWSDAGGAWSFARMAGPSAATPHPAVAMWGGATWIGWYEGHAERSYHVAVEAGDGAWARMQVGSGMAGEDSQYGHYAAAVAAGPDGALVAWPAHGEASTFPFAWLRLGGAQTATSSVSM